MGTRPLDEYRGEVVRNQIPQIQADPVFCFPTVWPKRLTRYAISIKDLQRNRLFDECNSSQDIDGRIFHEARIDNWEIVIVAPWSVRASIMQDIFLLTTHPLSPVQIEIFRASYCF